jgi:hypothetical protein
MWRGWQRRARRHELPPLVAVPARGADAADLETDARYFGTTVSGDWLDRVVARGLGSPSECRLVLSQEGLDVIRPSGAFRVPASALLAARHDQGIAGKVVPPHGLLVVTWVHGDLTLDTGFRVSDVGNAEGGYAEVHDQWVLALSTLAGRDAA